MKNFCNIRIGLLGALCAAVFMGGGVLSAGAQEGAIATGEPTGALKYNGAYQNAQGAEIFAEGTLFNDMDVLNVMIGDQNFKASKNSDTISPFVFVEGECAASITPYKTANGRQALHVEQVPLSTCTGDRAIMNRLSDDFFKVEIQGEGE